MHTWSLGNNNQSYLKYNIDERNGEYEEQSILDPTPSRSNTICECNKRCQAAVINKSDENPSMGENAKLC